MQIRSLKNETMKKKNLSYKCFSIYFNDFHPDSVLLMKKSKQNKMKIKQLNFFAQKYLLENCYSK